MKYISVVIIALISLVSCDVFKETDDRIIIARVGDAYLYQDDIKDVVIEGTPPNDSIQIVTSFINRWATQQLLLEGAQRNLAEEKQIVFNKLVEQYKNDLYSKAYLEALVYKSIDTSMTEAQAIAVYEANQETFKLNEELVKFRYITIPQNAIDEDKIKIAFKKFDRQDKRYLDSIAVQFKGYSLNDSIWIKASQITEKISVLNSENKKELLKKSNYIQLKDSLDLYLIQINDVLFQNDLAPLEYVKPTIKQIVINKRKLELVKQLEKDITKDAIKNKQFEIYN
ncbi:MAG: peptidyl-prolyl cis-trans isomerase [Psychroserpens sp.]|uniref:peptidyl-prolyl cis-trans isomerase n=1 Tax=Psychroserpens sp. TaxID=2020870 RepID=UPI003C79075E